MPSKHSKKGFLDSDSEEEEAQPKKKVAFLDSDEEEEEVKPKKKGGFLDSDDDEEEEEEEKVEERPKNVHGYAVASAKKKKSSGFLGSDDEEEEDEEGSDADVPGTFLSDDDEGSDDYDDDDDEDSDEDEDSDSDTGRGSWFKSGGGGDDDDDDSDDERRRVKTQAEKCYDELDKVYEQINQHAFEIDLPGIVVDFDALQKVFAKYEHVDGVKYPPKLYLFALIEIENFVSDTEGDPESKRLANSPAFNRLKQRLAKACAPFADALKDYRAKLESGDEDGKPLFEREEAGAGAEEAAEGGEAAADAEEARELTQEDIGKELAEMRKSVGKKEFNMLGAVARLNVFADKAGTVQLRLLVQTTKLSLLNNLFRATASSRHYMAVSLWKQHVSTLADIFALCEHNANLRVEPAKEDSADAIIQEALDTALSKEELEARRAAAAAAAAAKAGAEATAGAEAKADADGPKTYVISYNLYLVLETLDEELVKSLRHLDFHKFEYLSRVEDEIQFVELCKTALRFYERAGDTATVVKLAAQLVQHVYFRVERPCDGGALTAQVAAWTALVLRDGDERLKMRSVLAQIYQHALNDRFYEARDLLLSTHLVDVVATADVPTQILFNRALAQLGLAAFRRGMLVEARSYLADICNSPNNREIIGQGANRSREPTEEERARLVPFHMRISSDLIELAVLVSTMLEEIPAFVANPKRKEPAHARLFWRYYHQVQNAYISGAPTTREHIVAAARCLQAGDWRGCLAAVERLNAWKLIPAHTSAALHATLEELVKQEALRTMLFAHAAFFESIRLCDLVAAYEMPDEKVRSLVSRMILTGELPASIDQPSGTLVPLRQEQSELQVLSRQLAEKTRAFVDSSERILDTRTGCYGLSKNDKHNQTAYEQTVAGGIWSRQQQQQQKKKPQKAKQPARSPPSERSSAPRNHRRNF